MKAEITRKLTVLEEMSDVISEQILLWLRRVEAQKSCGGKLKGKKQFDMIRKTK